MFLNKFHIPVIAQFQAHMLVSISDPSQTTIAELEIQQNQGASRLCFLRVT